MTNPLLQWGQTAPMTVLADALRRPRTTDHEPPIDLDTKLVCNNGAEQMSGIAIHLMWYYHLSVSTLTCGNADAITRQPSKLSKTAGRSGG